MSFTRRTYPEVLDHVLTAVTAGVAAESHPFPSSEDGAPYRHSLLQPPAAEVVSVYGNRGGLSHLFRQDKDYALAEDGQTLEWLEEAELPDPGTLIRVNYYPESAQPVLTDIRTGSVVRTLCETAALEIARLHAQLEAVYKAGFIDTATDSALDKVVALLGIERIRAGRATGEVELTRSAASRGAIHVPAGTRILTADGNVEYETTAAVTLADGQRTIRVAARDLEPNDPLAADALTVLPVPIAGIAGVTNPAPTTLATREESDRELRQRAKSFLHGSERATLGALGEALARQGITADVVEKADQPGYVEITPHAEQLTPEQRQRLLTAIHEVRPAGVRVTVLGVQAPRKVNLRLLLTTVRDLPEEDLRGAHQAVRSQVGEYFARLPAKAAGSVNQLVSRIMTISGVEDVRLLAATWTVDGSAESVLDLAAGELAIAGFPTALGELAIADPNLATAVDAVIVYAADPPAVAAVEGALGELLTTINDASAAGENPTVSYADLLGALGAAPLVATFVCAQPSGLTRELSEAGDEYELTSFERLSVRGVTIREEGG